LDDSSGLSETDEFGKTLHSGTEDVEQKTQPATCTNSSFLNFKMLQLLSSVLQKHRTCMMLLRHLKLRYQKVKLLYFKRYIFHTA